VSDGVAVSSLAPFTITVEAGVNSAPTISGVAPTSVLPDAPYDFEPSASDADGDALTFSIENAPSWANFSTDTGALTGTPEESDEGTYSAIVISVADGTDSASLAPFSITVEPVPNRAPTIAGTPTAEIGVENNYSFTPSAEDADGDVLTFSIDNLPEWAGFNTATGALSGTPQDGEEGIYSGIVITVSDGTEAASLPVFSITVQPAPNSAPTITGNPDTIVTAGNTYRFTPAADDADGDALTFSIENAPAWASFSTNTGRLVGTPGAGDVGTYGAIVISVSDGTESASLAPFSITVQAVPNVAPTIAGTPATSVGVGEDYLFIPTADDGDGDALTFSISNAPAWANFSASTGRLAGAPDASDEGIYSAIVISVSDGEDSASLAAFSITVTALPNNAPTIAGTPDANVTAGEAYAFTPTADDEDGDTLTFSIENAPSWASFSTTTGALTGTPQEDDDEGIYSGIVISVSDGTDSASLAAFAITVDPPPNTAPTIEGTPDAEVTAGNAYSFTPTANDDDGDTLTFSIENAPSWASFSTTTGALTGTPQEDDDEGTYAGIVISVSDGTDSASLAAFAITVDAPPNTAPTIAGTPDTEVVAADAYAFTPTANDDDGDTLTFSIENAPSWASFSTTTGALTGTPQGADVGTYANIVISVSDGTDDAALAAFTIEVVAAGVYSVTLNWTPPTENTDDSALVDLEGYRIYYGTSPSNYTDQVSVDNAGLSSFVVDDLPAGTFYFAITAINDQGIESAFSDEVSTTLPAD
ncbi:MAG: putative Ig domain-containing protein, partial [Pseudomonadota bacterium]